MSNLSTIYLIKKELDGTKREISALEGNLLMGISGTVNFGHQSISNNCLGSVILGGRANTAVANYATIAGGENNYTCTSHSTIGGGILNFATGIFSTIGGGRSNCAIGDFSTVGGGIYNLAAGCYSTVGGGYLNCAIVRIIYVEKIVIDGAGEETSNGTYVRNSGGTTTFSGPNGNYIEWNGSAWRLYDEFFGDYTYTNNDLGLDPNNWEILESEQPFGVAYNTYSDRPSGNTATIGGGVNNCAWGTFSTIGGGCSNSATGNFSTIGGGFINYATALFSTVAGGNNNCATANFSTIGGGALNRATQCYSTVGGGVLNCATACFSTVAGGNANRATANFSTIGGGCCNFATANFSTVGGGCCNSATGNFSIVGGGERNCAFGSYSYIVGGRCSVVQTSHSGAAVLGDGQNRPHLSSGPQTLTLDFISGVYVKNRLIINNSDIPSSSDAFGISGQLTTDSNYIYYHDGVRWRRTALAEW